MNDDDRRRRIPPPPGYRGPIPTAAPAGHRPRVRGGKPEVSRGNISTTGTPVAQPHRDGFRVIVPGRWDTVTRDASGAVTERVPTTGPVPLAVCSTEADAAAIVAVFTRVGPMQLSGRPPKPLTPDETRKFLGMPAEVRALLAHIAAARLVTGQGPAVNQLWSVWHHGDLDHPARAGEWVTSKLDGRQRPARADARRLLSWLADEWFVRFSPDPGSVKLRGVVYQALRPDVVELLRSRGEWPPPARYSGPRRVR